MSTFMGKYGGTHKIDLGDGFYVRAKRCLTGTEREKALERTFSFSQSADGQIVMDKFDPLVQTYEYALASVVEWNLTEEDGSLMPLDFDPETDSPSTPSPRRLSYDRLPGFVQDEIEKVVMAGNAPFSTDESKRFPAGSGGGVPGEGDAPPDGGEVLDGAEVVG